VSKRSVLGAAVIAAFVLGLLLMVGSASAQTLTHPTWVSDSPATGTWILTNARAITDTTSNGLRAIECVATTETKFVAYWYRKGVGTDKRKWPVYGLGAADTCWTVPAGETRTYLFDKPWVQFIIVTSGNADFSGE
jgi:hypothetical protein